MPDFVLWIGVFVFLGAWTVTTIFTLDCIDMSTEEKCETKRFSDSSAL
jgi:hypothetical protein